MASAEAPAPVAAQTVVLRVSIHCLGCKKKVRKVLRGIEGVHDVKVDAAMHKVTVTGTVDSDTLVRRLYKSGKQALPWQHPHTAPVAPAAPAKMAEAAPVPEAPAPAGDAAADKKPEEQLVKETAPIESSEKKLEEDAESDKKPEAEKGTEPEKKEEEVKPSDEAKKDAGESEAAETKAKGGDSAEPAKEAVPAAAKEAGNDGNEEKKEKSKPKDAGDAAPAAAVTTERSLFPPPAAPKHAHDEHYPYPYYGAPQPVLSYHMAQPSASVSYYAPRPEPTYSVQQQPPPPQPQPQPMQQQWSPSYLYMPYPHSTPESYYHDYYSPPGTHSSPPLHDSYRMFDDENPNACTVM